MPLRHPRGLFRALRQAVAPVLVAISAPSLVPSPASAQTLTLKRELVDGPTNVCEAIVAVESGLVTESDRSEAARLANSATQASIVGDHGGARDLLLRATRLDPESGDVAYLLGRAYEELGEVDAATREYCRYLDLTPEAPDAADVQTRIGSLDPDSRPALSPEAQLQFRRGVAAFDLGQTETAAQAFTSVIASDPEFAPAHYNRALVFTSLGRRAEAVQDLEAYAALDAEAAQADQVASALTALRNPPRTYSAGGAMLGSLALPGVGQFYTGRSLAGFGFLAAAVGAAVFGELSERVQIECRVPPTNGVCDPSDVVAETREKPYRVAGYGSAAAIAIFAAIDAYRGAGRRNAMAGSGVTIALGDGRGPALGLPTPGSSPLGQMTLSLLRLSF